MTRLLIAGGVGIALYLFLSRRGASADSGDGGITVDRVDAPPDDGGGGLPAQQQFGLAPEEEDDIMVAPPPPAPSFRAARTLLPSTVSTHTSSEPLVQTGIRLAGRLHSRLRVS